MLLITYSRIFINIMNIIVLLGILLTVCKCQYIVINPKPSKLMPCDNRSSTGQLERFFDLIFTEFHNTPPACVCVQMCPQQPTYCYPNGCLRTQERRKVEEITYNTDANINFERTTKPTMFGVDQKDIADDPLDRPGLLTSYGEATEKLKADDLILQPNSFKELVLKYKKVPKLEMKYNLREQVKHTKSEKLNKEKNIDISKTRWPSNKHLLHGKSPFHRVRHHKHNDDTRQANKFFVSMFPEYDPSNYSPVFYKKYLTKRENNGVNVQAVYVYQMDSANFTLEALIDNLIESGSDRSKKDIGQKENIDLDDLFNQETITEANVNFTEINFFPDQEQSTNHSANDTALSIISMNSTNQNTDVNKYSHDIMNSTHQNTFLEMIASMSKEIEKQNKASLEIMERVTGRKNNILTINESVVEDKSLEIVARSNLNASDKVLITEEQTKVSEIETTSDKYFCTEDIINTTKKPLSVTETSVHMKSKQRVVRKLKRRKLSKVTV